MSSLNWNTRLASAGNTRRKPYSKRPKLLSLYAQTPSSVGLTTIVLESASQTEPPKETATSGAEFPFIHHNPWSFSGSPVSPVPISIFSAIFTVSKISSTLLIVPQTPWTIQHRISSDNSERFIICFQSSSSRSEISMRVVRLGTTTLTTNRLLQYDFGAKRMSMYGTVVVSSERSTHSTVERCIYCSSQS